MTLWQSEGLISVSTVRFVAAATLALHFRTEQSFLGASDEPLRFAAVSRANTMLVTKALSWGVMLLAFVSSIANPQGVAQSRLQSPTSYSV